MGACCSLEKFGVHLGENYPRLWLVIGEYKNAARILTIIVLILQIVRIAMVGYETKFVYEAYPQSETIGFCALSIILGIVSLGLESLLLYAIHKNNIKKIQPWFLCTFIIFLIACLAFVITSTLYIIRPIDHNTNVVGKYNSSSVVNQISNEIIDEEMSSIISSAMTQNKTTTESSDDGIPMESTTPSTNDFSKNETDFTNTTSNDECSTNNTCSILTDKNGTRVVYYGMEEDTEPKNQTAIFNNFSKKLQLVGIEMQSMVYNNNQIVPNITRNSNGKLVCNTPKPKVKKTKLRTHGSVLKMLPNETYAVQPGIPLTFLLDVVRCIPQLFLVNRFVKAEQLHEHLIHPSHSHTSLSALYVKPLPVLV